VSINALMVDWVDHAAHALWNVEQEGQAPCHKEFKPDSPTEGKFMILSEVLSLRSTARLSTS
jgi:hypothetical protein